jgi:hypothetical protein
MELIMESSKYANRKIRGGRLKSISTARCWIFMWRSFPVNATT